MSVHVHPVRHQMPVRVHADRRGWLVLEIGGMPCTFPLPVAYAIADQIVEVAEEVEARRHMQDRKENQ